MALHECQADQAHTSAAVEEHRARGEGLLLAVLEEQHHERLPRSEERAHGVLWPFLTRPIEDYSMPISRSRFTWKDKQLFYQGRPVATVVNLAPRPATTSE